MAILEQAYGYLSRIMSKEETFVTIMNRSIPNAGLSSEDTTLLRDVLKSAVNKYYFLRFEVRKGAQEIELESEETNVLILGLAFIHYVKNVDFDLVMKFFEEEYGSLPLRISSDQTNLFNYWRSSHGITKSCGGSYFQKSIAQIFLSGVDCQNDV